MPRWVESIFLDDKLSFGLFAKLVVSKNCWGAHSFFKVYKMLIEFENCSLSIVSNTYCKVFGFVSRYYKLLKGAVANGRAKFESTKISPEKPMRFFSRSRPGTPLLPVKAPKVRRDGRTKIFFTILGIYFQIRKKCVQIPFF